MANAIKQATKTCPKCKEEKPLDTEHFKYKNVGKPLRRYPTYCRPCYNKHMKGQKTKGLYHRDPVTRQVIRTANMFGSWRLGHPT